MSTAEPRASARENVGGMLAATILALALLAAGPSLRVGEASAEPSTSEPIPDQAIIMFEQTLPGDLAPVRSVCGNITSQNETLPFVATSVSPGELDHCLSTMRARNDTSYAYQPHHTIAQFKPDDTYFDGQWGLPAVGLPGAWDITLDETGTLGSHDVKIAVLDTGVANHPDLVPNLEVSDRACGPNFDFTTGLKGDPPDQVGHGTEVASVLGAVTNNGLDIAGVSQSCIMDLRVLGAYAGAPQKAALAIIWATDHGADVIQMSFGVDQVQVNVGEAGAPPLLGAAVKFAGEQGVLMIAAGGNRGQCDGQVCYPAAFEEVVAVSGLEDQNRPWPDSLTGPEIELAAPAESILVAEVDGGVGYARGTSVAASFVSGTAAITFSLSPDLRASWVRCILQDSADPVGSQEQDEITGHGRLNATAAIKAARDWPLAGGVCL